MCKVYYIVTHSTPNNELTGLIHENNLESRLYTQWLSLGRYKMCACQYYHNIWTYTISKQIKNIFFLLSIWYCYMQRWRNKFNSNIQMNHTLYVIFNRLIDDLRKFHVILLIHLLFIIVIIMKFSKIVFSHNSIIDFYIYKWRFSSLLKSSYCNGIMCTHNISLLTSVL